GILDADIYGPSVPRMIGALRQRPDVNEQNKIIPVRRLGLKTFSMGYLIDENLATIWRGPMLFKAMDQFFNDVLWAPLDYLVIDLPPGTGDIALTMAQKVPVQGAITVCTPQNIALADAQKAINMFENINIPNLGVIENMSYMIAPGSKEKIQMFPKGHLDDYLVSVDLPKLAEIPFNPSVSLSSEAGIPIVEGDPDCEESKAFLRLAKSLHERFSS
ncbi:MAG: Mrp/NBP35 family ATP-binding protein, partial [Bdellovibrionales bacterium]|nr:Mrp/NBP35 family ATP-binding protein [Bdellovibrionales bacterium]